ncbi:hypothetical protein DMUE_5373 [Dictyocoela muelleri]|nr:hypothetical protein DMUE_5373 [Dictyocoela muelleri]
MSGNISAEKIYQKLSSDYIGIRRNDVRKYVDKCEACKMTSSHKIKHYYHYILSRKHHEGLFLDIVDLSQYKEMNNEYRYILTCLDSFSKFAFCFQLYRKDAGIFSDKLYQLCAIEGRWEIIHTDNGK